MDTITTKEVEVASTSPAPESIYSSWTSMIPMVLIFAVFYFLLIRPQEKRRKEQEVLITGVKVGEKVVTSSGIFGVVTKLNDSDNTVNVEIAQGTQITMLKTAILDIPSRKKEQLNNKEKAK